MDFIGRERQREIDRSTHSVQSFASLEGFMRGLVPPSGIVTINLDGAPLDLLVSPARSRTALVFFHGAIERDFTLPVLSGLGISGGLEANRIFVSDPSIHLDQDLLLAWYAGNRLQRDLQDQLVLVLKHTVDLLGASRVVFFGGSGGGFASLYFASRFDNSLALAFNPQTNISRYMDRAVQDFAEKAFDVEAPAEHRLANVPRVVQTDLCQVYSQPKPPLIGYMQNLNDKGHIENQLRPFFAALHPENRAMLLADQWNRGHTPPPKSLLTEVLNAAASQGKWEDELVKVGFKTVDHAEAQRIGTEGP